MRAIAPLLLLAPIVALGLWTSFSYVLAVWPLDSDNAVPLALWNGVQRHGLGFLATWNHTPDSWLLTLLPFSALSYATLGAEPMVIVGMGWVVFVACVAVTGLLTAALVGWRWGAVAACVLLFANPEALGRAGYLGHPITHNISMVWALAALLLAVYALRRASPGMAIASALAVLANVISDPWAGAAIAIPIVLAAAVMARTERGARQGKVALILAGTTFAAFVIANTKVFGLLSFLPRAQFEFTGLGGMPKAAYWAFKSFVATFDIAGGGPPAPWRTWLNAIALGGLLLSSLAIILRQFRHLPDTTRFWVMTAVLSLGGVSAPYLLGSWNENVNVGRFFHNVYFFAGMFVVVACAVAPAGIRLPFRALAATYAVLFMVSGVVSQPAFWLRRPPPPSLEEARALGAFLQSQGLSYGYGPYWGAHSLIMDTATHGAVTIRPASFMKGPLARRAASTSSHWYEPGDEPAGLRERFLIIMSDGEECPDVPRCIRIAEAQVGPPARRLSHGAATILIWDRPIAAGIVR